MKRRTTDLALNMSGWVNIFNRQFEKWDLVLKREGDAKAFTLLWV